MTKKNPFPGMNPFIEQQRWRDAHTRLIAYTSDALQERLPEDLVAGAEEDVISIGMEDSGRIFRPDVQIREPWTARGSGVAAVAMPQSTVETEGIYVLTDDEVERWVEIHDETGRLITVVEVLSPTNKMELRDRERHMNKRRDFVRSGVNIVEIDLIRQGSSVFGPSVTELVARTHASYAVCVFSAALPKQNLVYPISLRARLPAIRIPLRPTDADVILELQPLVDQCHERGRYHRLDYTVTLAPPLKPEDATWVEAILRENGLC